MLLRFVHPREGHVRDIEYTLGLWCADERSFISRTEEGQSTHLLRCVAVVYHVEEAMVRHCIACLRRQSDTAFYCRSTSQVYDGKVCKVHCFAQSAVSDTNRRNDTHIWPWFLGQGCNEGFLVRGRPAFLKVEGFRQIG